MRFDYETDIVIIGAGPAGLFAIFQAGMLKMRCHVVDNLPFIGGQCSALYPEKPIFDIPAYPSIDAQSLINNLEKQAAPFHPTYHLNQQVISFHSENNDLFITTSIGIIIKCKAIIIAAGSGAFGPNRPPIHNIQEYEEKTVFYSVRRMADFAGKRIVIAGGGDSAVDWALNLVNIAEKIYVVHRRSKFRCAPESSAKLEQLALEKKIELVIPYQLHSLEGANGQVERVIVEDLDHNTKSLEANILLPFFGLAMELGPILHWNLDLEKKHISVDPSSLRTNIPNVYAIGDIVTYKGKLKLILNGFAEAATACHDIYNIVHPETPLHFEYSTTKGVETIGS
jgi:thioredoxin reductase (NADPH)